MTPLEILQRCLAQPGELRGLDKPILDQHGYIYSTNGHIMVRMHATIVQYTGETMPDQGDKTTKASFFDGVEKMAFKPLPDVKIPEPITCSICEGYERLVKCECCDGHGQFVHFSHEYDCQNCNQIGGFPDVHGTMGCPECDGWGEIITRRDGHIDVDLYGMNFAARYVRFLSKLPGIQVAITPDETKPSYFKFDAGFGVLMSKRK